MALDKSLKEHFTDCVHVDETGLQNRLTDIAIWNFAKENDFLIFTNDEDFLHFINVKGFPPKIILLGTGNQSNQFILSVLIKHKEAITSLFASEEYGLLEIY